MKAPKILLNDKWLGQLMFLVLFVLAAVFYLERTLFVDPCYALFNLFYYHDFVAEAGRHAAVLPQSLPLLAIRLGLPLRAVMMLYSVSFILLYYLVWLLIAYGFRLERIALAVPLVLVLGVKYSFFWISTETHQALVYTVLFYAFLEWSYGLPRTLPTALLRLAGGTAILLTAFYTHPIALFTVLFALGFHVVDRKLWLKPDGYLLGAAIVAVALYKYLTSNPTGYESTYFRGFADFFNRIGELFASGSFQFMRRKLFNIYLVPMAIFFATVVWYIMRKQYLKLAYYLAVSLLFSLVLFTTFDIWYLPFIQEKNLMGLMLLLLIPFLKDVLPAGDSKGKIPHFIVLLIFVSGTVHVVAGSAWHLDRVRYIRETVQELRKFPEKKFVIPESLVNRERLAVNWAFGPETLLASALDGADSCASVYIDDPFGKLSDSTDYRDTLRYICAPWAKHLEVRQLDRRFFNLRNSAFRVLNEKDMVKGNDIVFYENRFDDPRLQHGTDSLRSDTAGNRFLVTTTEFSPGFYGRYADVSTNPALLITASVRLCAMEPADAKNLNLIISRERNNTVYEYYMAGVKPDSLLPGRWNRIEVSGIVRSSDPGDQLKIYLWNPGKKAIGMDDLRVAYRAGK